MRLTDLRLSVYSQLAACLQQCSHGDGDSPGEPWWVVMAVHLDITRQEQMDIGEFLYPDYHFSPSDHKIIKCDIVSGFQFYVFFPLFVTGQINILALNTVNYLLIKM